MARRVTVGGARGRGARAGRAAAVAKEVVVQEERRLAVSSVEEDLMAGAKVPLPGPLAPGPEAARTLSAEGAVHLGGVLAPELADALRDDIDERLGAAGTSVRLGGAKNRFDLKLELAGHMRAAVMDALHRGGLASVLMEVAPDAFLAELGVLVSFPGAPRQPIHPDTVCTGSADERPIYTTFVALQDVTDAMGPTTIIPGTHNLPAHEELCGIEEDTHRALLLERPSFDATMRKGDAVIFDSRTLHCGGENSVEGGTRRAQLYVSVQSPVPGASALPPAPQRRTDPSAYSILARYHNRFRLRDSRDWRDDDAAGLP